MADVRSWSMLRCGRGRLITNSLLRPDALRRRLASYFFRSSSNNIHPSMRGIDQIGSGHGVGLRVAETQFRRTRYGKVCPPNRSGAGWWAKPYCEECARMNFLASILRQSFRQLTTGKIAQAFA